MICLHSTIKNFGDPCGKDKPSNISDCVNYSEINNKCCYYNITSQCFWLGEDFSKQIVQFNTTINCASSYIKSVLNILILILLDYICDMMNYY